MNEFEQTKMFYDQKWHQSYGECVSPWIINAAQAQEVASEKATALRRIASFCTPDVCARKGNDLVFSSAKAYAAAKHTCVSTLAAIGVKMHLHSVPQSKPDYTWKDMTHQQQVSFAKAIWAQRPVQGHHSFAPFADYVQHSLCRTAGAPSPAELKTLLEKEAIDVTQVVVS